MSLRVWLPLTKDLRNQGLDDVTITNNGATFNSAGKLGGCYQFGPRKNIKLMEYASTFSSFNEFSLSVWFKCTAQNTGHSGSALISCGNWNQATHLLNLALGYYDTDHYTKLLITNNSSWSYGYSYNFQLDTWYHVVLTSGQEEVKAYVNGELIGSSKNAIVPTDMEQSWICIGNATYYSSFTFNGFMNDVRIYNQVLSPMEVKQLSQGLVLHYPLNRQGFGQENLLKNTNDLTKWNKESGISVEWDETELMYKVFTTTRESSRWGIYQDCAITVDTDTDYTFSLTGKTDGFSAYLSFGAGTSWPTNYIAFTTTKQRLSKTLTIPAGTTNIRVYLAMYPKTGGGHVYFEKPKLEKGSIPTPWCPNSSDVFATTMGLNSTTEYDCSGFCNNGTRTGTFTWTSDTPKYSVSTQFNGTQVIQLPFSCSVISEAITVACWGYESNWNTSSAERLIGAATNSSGWCIGDYSSENTLFAFYANGGYNVATGFKQLTAGWHHFVITFDGLNLKYYVDGQQFSSKTFSTKQVAIGNYNIEIGRHYGDGCNFKGRMSDVRIYATALSASDVLSLYQNCATIDPDGTIRGQIRS